MRQAPLLCLWLLLSLGCGSSRPTPGQGTATGGAGGAGGAAPAHSGGQVSAAGEQGHAGAGASAGAGGASQQGPYALGASMSADAIHFRVRADAATALELNVYESARDADEVARFPMTREVGGSIWVADVPRARLRELGVTTVYYGYRAWGPNWPADPAWTKGSMAGFVSDVDALGNRFNPNKLLIDPYARELSHDPLQPGAVSPAPYLSGAADRSKDNGRLAPKSIVFEPDGLPVEMAPARALKDDVIYEVNLRGLTMNDPSIPQAARGTFAGAALKASALAALGITALELLPIQETQNDHNDADTGAQNYWGYSTLAFFAPDRRYSSDKSPGGPTRELKAMVRALHAQGIKVILDVVYNHTAEGGVASTAPTIAQMLSFRGLDNAGYYELTADKQGFVDNTGTGANFNAAAPLVRDLVLDSLAYWKNELGIDGFRFDLASVLGNSCLSDCFAFDANDPKGILARAVAELPARPAGGGPGVDLIAEPWALGDGTYQLGRFPAGWSEWNGSFRDTIRSAQNELGTTALTPNALAQRISGSPDLFNHDARAPSASIAFGDCHDGFTLHDLYAYNSPQNAQAYPFGPSDGGSAENRSWDQGGSTSAQTQAARTGLALVALSAGVPMIQGGDEVLRSQAGNNNAYNLDNSELWLDHALDDRKTAFSAWTSALFSFRAAHSALRPAKFLSGTDHNSNGLPDITWLDDTGSVASATYLGNASNHFLAWRIDGSEANDSARSILIAWNAWTSTLTMSLPPAAAGFSWWMVGDSATGGFSLPGEEAPFAGAALDVPARTITVLIER
jgi:isoamylase